MRYGIWVVGIIAVSWSSRINGLRCTAEDEKRRTDSAEGLLQIEHLQRVTPGNTPIESPIYHSPTTDAWLIRR